MKKLLFGLLLAGLWFASSRSEPMASENEFKKRAQDLIKKDVARFEAEKLSNHYENEFKISLREEGMQLQKFQRQFTNLIPQSTRVDDKNGAKVLELSQAITKAREATARAIDELYTYLGPVKSPTGGNAAKEHGQ